MSDFDWNDLRAFLAVVRTGRLTAAAAQLGVNHSTLSRRIAGLEQALHTNLFDRYPTGYVLTRSGRILVEQAEALESLAIQIGSRIAEPNAGIAGPVRLATPEGFGTCVLAGQLGPLLGRHPGLRIELMANPGVVSLTKREADIAVTMACPDRGRLRARKLTDYELGLYGATAYLAERGSPASVQDITQHRLIGYIPDLLPTPAHDYLKEVVGQRPADVTISNILTQMEATVMAAGLCILPCYMADACAGLMRVLPRAVTVVRSYWVVVHAEERAPVRMRLVSDFLHEVSRRFHKRFLPDPAGMSGP